MSTRQPWWWWIVPLTDWMNVLADRLEAKAAAIRRRSDAKVAAILRDAGCTEGEVGAWLRQHGRGTRPDPFAGLE